MLYILHIDIYIYIYPHTRVSSFPAYLPYLPTYLCMSYLYLQDDQIMHHSPCFNLFFYTSFIIIRFIHATRKLLFTMI